jgi:ubiquitin-protein ligase
MPAVNRFTEGWDRMARAARADAGGDGAGAGAGGVGLEEALFRDTGLAHLLEPELAADATGFAVLTVSWVAHLLAEGGPDAVAAVPEYALRDAAAWVAFCVRCGGADVVGGSDVGALVGGVSAFLRADGVAARSPLAAAACVEMLQAMLAPQLDARRIIGGADGASLGPTAMSPGERALVATVLATGAAQAALIPALMRAHAGADVVVGLDVDKDRFDKFGFRTLVDSLLMELWNDGACLAATARLAGEAGGSAGGDSGGGAGDAFDAYVGAVLNSLIYLLDDCLVRLQAMADVEAAKAVGGGAAWAALPARERAAKEAFLQGEAGTTRGFMGMARRCLAVLARLAGEAPIVAASFGARPELAAQAAHAVSAFVNAVAGCDPGSGGGRRAVEIASPERFKYDPPALLASILAIALRIDVAMAAAGGGGGVGLAPYLAAEAEFEPGPARRAAAVVGKRDFGAQSAFEALVDRAAAVRAGKGAGAGGAVDAPAGGDAAAAAPAGALVIPALPPTVPPPPPDLGAAYAAALGPLAFGEWDSEAGPAAYSRVLGAQSLPPGAALPRKAAKRIAKELRDLGAAGGLPLAPGASIFIRADPDRADRLRALVTGPEGTPYAGGCFVFDLLFPPAYPDVPPAMLLATTGGGRARFNPNLYADGKVCLSLLGTWHGTDESEKWSAADANVWRVLVSIQGMILVDDPYFNEPGADAVRGTPEGAAQAARYNAKLAANVVRYAMAAHLDSPPPGFEDVVAAHFRALRHKVVAWAGAAAAAAEAAGDGAAARRLVEEVAGLVGKLAAL